MRKIAVSIMFLIGIFVLTACNSGNSEIVAKTDAGDVTKDDFYEELKDRHGEQVLQEMVTIKILEDKFTVKEEEIDKQVEIAKNQLGEQFDMWLVQQGYGDEESFRDIVRINLLFDEAVYGDVEVTDEEIKQFYERISKEVEAEHILVKEEDLALDIIEKLENGEDFATLAKEHSTDTGSAEEGGFLGVVPVGEFVIEFEDAAYALDVDTISEPVKSDYGYHIIRVTDIRDVSDTIGSLEDNELSIINALRAKKIDPIEGQAKLTELIDSAKVNIKIPEYKDLFKTEG